MILNLSLIILDIDYFKIVNDSYGHTAGDKVLKLISKNLKENIRDIDTLARWGGEEFIILLPETNSEGAWHISEKIRMVISSLNIITNDHIKISVSASFGTSSMKKNDSTSTLISRADEALYKSKENGRNMVSHC